MKKHAKDNRLYGGKHNRPGRPSDRQTHRSSHKSRDKSRDRSRDRSRERSRVTKQPKMEQRSVIDCRPPPLSTADMLLSAAAAMAASVVGDSQAGSRVSRAPSQDRQGGGRGGGGRGGGHGPAFPYGRYSSGGVPPSYRRPNSYDNVSSHTTMVPPPASYPMGQREMLQDVAQETLTVLPKVLQQLGREKEAQEAVKITLDILPRLHPDRCPCFPRPATIRVVDADTLNAAVHLAEIRRHVAPVTRLRVNTRPLVVNFANRHSPGGGWRNGAMAQEEALCYRSSLALSLHRKDYPLAGNAILYSPYVLVIRHDRPSGHRLMVPSVPVDFLPEISCVTVAAIKGPPVEIRMVAEGGGRGSRPPRPCWQGDRGWNEEEDAEGSEDDHGWGRARGDPGGEEGGDGGPWHGSHDDAEIPASGGQHERADLDDSHWDNSRSGDHGDPGSNHRRSRSHGSLHSFGGGDGGDGGGMDGRAHAKPRCHSVEMADDDPDGPPRNSPRIVTVDGPRSSPYIGDASQPPYGDVTSSEPPVRPRASSPPSPSHPGPSTATPGGGGGGFSWRTMPPFASHAGRPPRTPAPPRIREKAIFARDYDRDLTKAKMRLTLRMAAANGHHQLVLGALGCGVFGNPPEDVAHCWLEVLREDEFAGNWWSDVIFAVYSGNRRANAADGSNFGIFRRVLHGQRV